MAIRTFILGARSVCMIVDPFGFGSRGGVHLLEKA